MTRFVPFRLFSVLLSVALGAGILVTAMPVAAEDTSGPATAVVRTTASEVLNRLHADPAATSANPQRLYAIAEEVVLPHFDFVRMSQRVLGKHWRSADPAQRERFVGEFKTLLVRTYATAVSDYRDAQLSFQPARALGTDVWRVRSNVDRGSGAPPLQVDYDVYRNGDAWKVFDVAINGVSLVVSYRAGFNTDIAKLGMDGLIDQIAQHNVQKASGT
ncbi:MAG: ABC transporter substrate-binding protein [Gammaproteobacteria bacterium]|nr:ABC transporter substrate-binding protein [Gammaproteobacteria bacterium]